MPQETNLNVNPYFDDFDKNKNFYRVLFKPGSPVQARELSTLQSILQNQIEQFGTHFFKEGSKVIPGNLSYDNNFTCVQIDENFLGISVSLYLDQLIGLRITGARSGVTATIKKIISKEDSDRGNNTLYVKYEKSGDDFTQEKFDDGESLSANKDIIFGSSVIAASEPFANTLAFGATATGSAMSIGEGVYFIRGTFAQVQSETLVLDQYSNTPSYRVGFDVQEDFVTADEDPSLNDNASGFTNFAAPGADRLQIKISLKSKSLSDTNDQNFIEIARVEGGELQTFVKDTQYNLIRDTLAKRTYDESGDYYIRPFEVFMKESLNDQIGNKGIYTSEQKTQQGNIPSKDLMVLQVSPGKAYVKGFSIEKIATGFIDVPKPRTTKAVEQEAVAYSTGDPLFVNNVFGSPSLGIGTTATVSLMSRRRGDGGSEIGLARLYDFKAQSASFVNQTTKYETRLFDIKTFTDIKVGTAITALSTSDHVEGARSGATGFVRAAGTNVTDFSLIDVNGTFIKDESILINGVQDGRTITKVDSFGFNDVKSLKSAVGVSTFQADIVLDVATRLTNKASSNFRLTNAVIPGHGAGNAGVIKAAGKNFVGLITANNIVSYTVPGETIPRFNRIVGVSTDGTEIQVAGITSVPSICGGGVHDGSAATTLDLNDLSIRKTTFTINANTLLTPVRHNNIESLDVTSTTVQLRKQFTDISVSSNSFTSPQAGTDLFFQPFDEERYFISYDDGSIEPLVESQVEIAADKKTVTFVRLSKTDIKANLFTTVLKSKVKNKLKKLNDANVINITRSSLTASGIGTNSLNDGLTHNPIFGTRVQDRKISLNVPDACQLLAVIESNDSGDADLPALTMTAYSGPSGNNSDLVVGEKLTGLQSNAVGLVVEKPNVTTVGIVLLNENNFNIGETVKSDKSGINALVTATTDGDRNITNEYSLSTNQKPTYYDFSFIERGKNFEAPTNRLKIVFKNFFVTSDDTGDFFNASSYPTNSENLIPVERFYGQTLSDLIDIRPRVSAYNTSSTISPFDFASRNFASQGDSTPDPLVPDETLVVSYAYYQGRKDRLFLDKAGDFIYLQGVPSDDPKEPQSIGDAIEVAKIAMPPFVDNVNQIKMIRTNHKRFTMADIGRLEKRLENVEYYTRLSLLETDTANLNITDANGLNRFKSGFFVDNFKKHAAHQIGHPDFSASTDAKMGYLRPGHYTTCLDLIVGSRSFIGIGTTANPTLDINHLNDIDGENIRKTGRLLTLDYTESEMLRQVYASRTENVNPFLIVYYSGDMEISPDSDIWMDTKRVDASVTEDTSQYDIAVASLGIDTQTGFSEVNWGAWETNWTSEEVESTWERTSTETRAIVDPSEVRGGPEAFMDNVEHIANYGKVIELNGKWLPRGEGKITDAVVTAVTQYEDVNVTTQQSREGIQYQVTPKVTEQSLGDRTLSRDIIPYMRKRNIQITTHRMKPRTRFYVYFDNVDVTSFTTPKLLEVNMTQGVFQTGETVFALSGRRDSFAVDFSQFKFRLAAPNHKEGPYNAPTKVLTLNPYDNAAGISTVYSSSSTILNVDTFSLATQVQGQFSGHVKSGMQLIGATSGAEATVTDVRLISDTLGNLTACYEIPDPNADSNPRFETGTKTLRLTTSPTNSTVVGTVTGSAEANFQAKGQLETVQEQVLSIKTPQIERLSTEEQRVLNERITRRVTGPDGQVLGGEVLDVQSGVQYYDPLAQTFRVDETTGVFITSVDVFMQTKDEELPLTLQVRTVETGLPTSKILPFSVVVKDPSEVNVSEDASIPTTFTFDAPVYLTGEQEYALVLVTPAENYNCWISRMGEVDISTVGLPDEQQVLISQQPYLGSLFKSQNGTTWDPSQYEDMKFVIKKAVFNTGTSVGRFFNSNLETGNDEVPTLPDNSIKTLSKKAVVGLGTTIAGGSTSPLTTGLIPGVTITQFGNLNASATLITTAGIATINDGKDITIINPGSGYDTDGNINKTYSDIPMITRTGSGSGAIGNVTVTNGQIGVVTFTNGGKNYAVGDTLGIATLGTGNARAGSGAILSVGVITATNSIVIDNIQGSFNIGVGTIGFNNGSTVLGLDGTTGEGASNGGNVGSAVTISSFDVDSTNDGLHFKVDHRSHGLHAFNNLVKISGVDSDIPSTTLTADYDNNSSSDISVVSSSNFATFEGVGVGTTNFGYAILGNEIISYTGVANGSITGITTRGIDDTIKSSHSSGNEIKKYEFSGVSLRRINKTHDMNSPSATIPNDKDLDFYHIKVDMSKNGENRSGGSLPDRFFSSTKRGGGSNSAASQNIQFETITPNIEIMTPPGTTIGGRIRTISATSVSGSEQSFADQGFEPVSLNNQNHFETPRMIASKENEARQLSDLPGNKSLTLEVLMKSNSPNVSPVIDLDRVSTVLTTNRLNSPVSNFATDNRVNQTGQDPCASTYVSNLITLANPATYITVEFAAYRRSSADIRVFYKILSEGSTENSMDRDFELFPGFDNIDQNGEVINVSNNSGRPDSKVTSSIGEEFKDYSFSSRDLPPFTKFQIKIDLIGTDQAKPPYIKELRAIALA